MNEKRKLMQAMWDANHQVHRILREAQEIESARERLFFYLAEQERVLVRSRTLKALVVFRNVISKRNERLAKTSCLHHLYRLAIDPTDAALSLLEPGFFQEFRHLFAAAEGVLVDGASKAAFHLDDVGKKVDSYLSKYPSGLAEQVHQYRDDVRRRMTKRMSVRARHWRDWRWQLKNVIHDSDKLSDLLHLTEEERASVDSAVQHGIPFGITPYYASLLDGPNKGEGVSALRLQVLPTPAYVGEMIEHRKRGVKAEDFMGETETSPVDFVVRRYPKVAVLKPSNACAQVCTYCQRNWEMDVLGSADESVAEERLSKAMRWLSEHEEISEVLVTGGDVFVMEDSEVGALLSGLIRLDHIERIRFCTRTPAVLPQRITEKLVELLASYHRPGCREICIVTHFQHPLEITPDAVEAVQRFRKRGISVYNQSVFTVQNTRRFELAALRRCLKLIGVDPYYTFAIKGKKECGDVQVPLARLMQERDEESRLLPGLVRTDDVVFNIPRVGKSSLISSQHQVIMIAPDGGRVIEFEPWSAHLGEADPYIYKDMPIIEYLERLKLMGEDPKEYESIWYYY
jgi:lysine 2,3-aminomutase